MNVLQFFKGLPDREPIRLYVWPAIIGIAGVLVITGVASGDAAMESLNFVIAAIGLLGGLPAAEIARKKVTSNDTLGTVIANTTDATLEAAKDKVVEHYGENAGEVIDMVRADVEEYKGKHRKEP